MYVSESCNVIKSLILKTRLRDDISKQIKVMKKDHRDIEKATHDLLF